MIIRALASLRLTVLLLALLMMLVFIGTIAQAQLGVWPVIDGYFRSWVAWIAAPILLPPWLSGGAEWSLPFPGGLLLGGLLAANLVAAHAVRFRLQKRRVGIIALHLGLLVLIAGEFGTAFFADEGLMSIDEGRSANYVEDIRSIELVVIDHRGDTHDRVVSFPQSMVVDAFARGETLTDPSIPFSLRVRKWQPNAQLFRVVGPTIADRGVGLEAFADEIPRVRGVDGAQSDAPAAYVTIERDGAPVGTWLLSALLIDAQPIESNANSPVEREWSIALRYRRTYLPYTLHLIEFRHDRFVGTEIARNFSSRVRLVDPARHVDREITIRMNHPLRHGGATFYQASYKPDETGTVLQVVRNPAAILPYVACVLVGGGMIVHFLGSLVRFSRRRVGRRERDPQATLDGTRLDVRPNHQIDDQLESPLESPLDRAAATNDADRSSVRGDSRAIWWVAAILGFAIVLLPLLRPTPASDFDLDGFGRIPVSSEGRVKPLDTTARTLLMIVGGRQSATRDGRTIAATEVLLDLIAHPERVRTLPLVRVDHPDLLGLLGLEPHELGRLDLNTIERNWQAVTEQAIRASDVDPKRRDPFQQSVIALHHHVALLLEHARMRAPYAIPPRTEADEWRPFHEAFMDSGLGRPAGHPLPPVDPSVLHPALLAFTDMMTAYEADDATAFNAAVAAYLDVARKAMPTETRKASIEVYFNRLAPFRGATVLYAIAFLALCASLLLRARRGGAIDGGVASSGAAERMRLAASGLLWAAFAVHTISIVLRIYLQDRPPVTNLYSSAIFVGWGAVLIGLILERIHPIAIAALGAATVGFVTLIVAHNLGNDGDTMQMMQAVLDSNFWLATHVTTITIGYSAAFLAGALGIVYLLLGVLSPLLTRTRADALARMTYGVVCFALLFSFVGTVLGGIWADQSWGRFWGWDPKENGAAMIVLLNAIILHARWGGLIRQRGLMLLAIGGNIVTAWSWFGTNMLGVGLHAYGFMESGVFWMMLFVTSQFALIALGSLPVAVWRSAGVLKATPQPDAGTRRNRPRWRRC